MYSLFISNSIATRLCPVLYTLCYLGEYFYFENLKDRYFRLTNILRFPVSPAGFVEFNLCAITPENSVFYLAAALTLIYVRNCTKSYLL